MNNRLSKISSLLAENKIQALFVTNQTNVSYLTGFAGLSRHGREAFLLVTRHYSYLLTFPTYYGLYSRGGEGFETRNITHEKRLSDHLTEIFTREKITRIGIEKNNMTLGEFASLGSKIKADFVPSENIVEKARLVKSEKEIRLITRAARLTDQTYDHIRRKIKPGVSEKELALEIEFFIRKNGAGLAFSPIVAFGKNSAIPHYLPSIDHCLRPDSLIILLDFGAGIEGYCSDMTRVIFPATPSGQLARLYETVLKTQMKAIAGLRPGIRSGAADEESRKDISQAGYPPFPHGLGHGVGLDIHEDPRLKQDSNLNLQENMVVTVEPGIYLEGKYGVRIEDLVVLKSGGAEILSKSPKTIRESII